jgi:hypothetical protein
VPFRASSFEHLGRITSALLGGGGPVHWIHPFVWVALVATALAHWLHAHGREDLLMLRPANGKAPWYAPAVLLSLVWLSVLFAADGFTPFLYAKF